MRFLAAVTLIGLALGLPAIGLQNGTGCHPRPKPPQAEKPPPTAETAGAARSGPSPAQEAADPLVPPVDLDAPRSARLSETPSSPDLPETLPGPVSPAGLSGPSDLFDFDSDLRAHFHPHGKQVCASGCAASNHPTPTLTRERFLDLLARYALGPADETNQALETLLYHGRQSLAHLDRLDGGPLQDDKLDFLRRELSRTHARIAFRLVDERGTVRTRMPPTRVPLDRRHVFEMETHHLQPLVTSGTVKRVGLHHLWTRI